MLKKCVLVMAAALSFMMAQSVFAAVEINTADQAQLDTITGIGPATSRAILEERKKNGNFKDWADLEQRVRGIGERNSVMLSAAGLVVNGQPRAISAEDSGSGKKAVKVAKTGLDAAKADASKAEAAKTGSSKGDAAKAEPAKATTEKH